MNENEIGGIFDRATKAHKKLLLTYLHPPGRKVGHRLNFGEALMKDVRSLIIND